MMHQGRRASAGYIERNRLLGALLHGGRHGWLAAIPTTLPLPMVPNSKGGVLLHLLVVLGHLLAERADVTGPVGLGGRAVVRPVLRIQIIDRDEAPRRPG